MGGLANSLLRAPPRRRPNSSPMWRSRSLIVQAECGTFACDRILPDSRESWFLENLGFVRIWLREKGNAMKRTLMGLAAVAAGLLGGAIIGGAIASNPYYYGPGYYGPGYYGPGYGYYGRPAYVAADPY